jgi:alpha-beta hydrolase superfamily lysophospholipase
MDLLTPVEELDRRHVFDIELLGRRVEASATWLRSRNELAGLPLGLFGASTGSAAALVAAADLGRAVGAVVSRGGRPDLAGTALPAVTAPTLLVVGGADPAVLEVNRSAQARMRCATRLTVVPGATHLFAEAGALEQVAALASRWFTDHLAPAPAAPTGPAGPSGDPEVRRS